MDGTSVHTKIVDLTKSLPFLKRKKVGFLDLWWKYTDVPIPNSFNFFQRKRSRITNLEEWAFDEGEKEKIAFSVKVILFSVLMLGFKM